ncbi:MAG: hypothetical protein IJR51_09865 [Clostridia bacterium]|nr:hypothetical protein [Clostridia bacterium]MBQ9507448.1 hypothetical protein [Clostridia bacterium]
MKATKSVLSVCIALVLLLIPVFSVFGGAVSAPETVTRDCPEIYVHGFMASRILYDKDDPSKGYVWDWSTEEITDLIKTALPIMAKYFFMSDWDGMAEEITPLVLDFFDGCVMNPDGSAPGNSGVDFTYPPANSIKKNSKLDFNYDWRSDPMQCAEELNDFINYVLRCSGSDQVTLTCHSQGGVVTTAYISVYGDSKIRSVVYNTTAIYGETYTGELLSGKMTLTADAVEYYLQSLFEGMEYEKLLNGIMKVSNDLGLLDFICDFGNVALEKLSPKLLPNVVVPLFGHMPSIWAMCPDEYLDDARDYVFNTIYKDSDIDHSGLIEKLDNYDTVVRAHKTETLLQLNEDAFMYVFSRYGYSSLFLIPSYTSLSDSVIDTKYSSFGATAAEFGKTLTDEELAGADMKHVSPDRMVNANTCLFPEQTWFFKDFPHSVNSPLRDMMDVLLYTDFQATVDTYDEYPQFMQYDRESDTVSPYTAEQAAADRPWYVKFMDWLTAFSEKLTELFERIGRLIASVRSI